LQTHDEIRAHIAQRRFRLLGELRIDRRCSMTALQVAKAECANCDSAGNCAGVGIADDLSCYMFRQPGKCWLAPDAQGKIGKCQYFEECVAPLAKKRAEAASTQEQKRDAMTLAKGVHAYELAVMSVPTAKYAKCKSCHRRVHVPKRLCEKCARSSTLKSKRHWWVKTRRNQATGALITKDL
jgi:hypothetical protein